MNTSSNVTISHKFCQFIWSYCKERERERVDNELLLFKIGDGSQIKYVSFKYSNTNIRLTILYMNNMCNVEVGYDFFVNIDVEDKICYNRVEECLRDIILGIKYNKAPLFVGVK